MTVEPPKEAPRHFPWQRLGILAVLLALTGVAIFIYFDEIAAIRTDDATIEADVVTVTAKVPAYVQILHVDDNSPVTTGETMIELDPRDYAVLVDAARAALDAANSRLAEARAQVVAAAADVSQAVADANAADAQSRLATSVFHRRNRLTDLSISAEGKDTAFYDADAAQASLASARQKATGAQAREALAEAQEKTAETAVAEAKVALDQALLTLSYTKIIAAVDGTVANRSVVAGNYVQTGQQLLAVVPNRVYAIANFKETQLRGIEPGRKAIISVDALDGQHLKAHVDSVQRGSGSRFALLPPENATGNFVKVVQRVPVKLIFDEPPERLKGLAPGLSVIVRIAEEN